MRLKFLHLHLHGLIRSKNLELGRDADTGGQTQYVLELIKSLANTSEVDQVDLVTRLIKDPKVDDEYSQKEEFVEPGVRILRFKFGPNKYLRKDYDLKFFYIKVLKKRSYRGVLYPFRKEFRIAEIIKIQRNTTKISYFKTFLRYFAV